jgi:hypothetical protein
VIGNGHAGFGRGDAGKGPARAPRQHPYLTLREPRIGVTLASRHHGLPDHVLQIAWRAQHRLHRVHRRLRAHLLSDALGGDRSGAQRHGA